MIRPFVLLFSAILGLSFSQGQEQRLRKLPTGTHPTDYWAELSPVQASSMTTKAAPVEERVSPTRTPVWQSVYTLGPGDTLTLSVYDRPDLTRENLRIAPDGTLSYLQAVAVKANGLTLDQLRVRLETALGQYQKNVKLIITPVGINSKNFAIIGRVRKPGSYTLDRPTSILEGIAMAQGIQIGSVGGSAFELADLERSFVARKGRKLSIDLAKLYYEGDFSQNAFLEPSDYIYVASNLDNEVYVLGSVATPGRRKMLTKLTITKAIAEAGGFTDDAYRIHVLLVRGSIHSPETRVVNVKAILTGKEPDVDLCSRDIIFVDKRPFELVERVLDTAIFTFMQTVTTEALNINYTPLLLGN
jgi:polysaccharide export outer membrane protein